MRRHRPHLVSVTLIATAAIGAVAAPVVGASNPDQPLRSIKILEMPMKDVQLVQSTFNKVCTGEGDALTCTAEIGHVDVEERDIVDVVDTKTGTPGYLSALCTTTLTGTTITYQNAPGVTDAAANTTCGFHIALRDGRTAIGYRQQQRRIREGRQESIVTISIMSSTDRAWIDVGGGTEVVVMTSPWEESPPISQDSAKRLEAGGSPRVRRERAVTVVLKKVPRARAWFTSITSIAPSNRDLPVRVTTFPGATCVGAIRGPRTITLTPAIANAKGLATMGTIEAGELAPDATWTATATCRSGSGSNGASAVAKTRFATREIPS